MKYKLHTFYFAADKDDYAAPEMQHIFYRCIKNGLYERSVALDTHWRLLTWHKITGTQYDNDWVVREISPLEALLFDIKEPKYDL